MATQAQPPDGDALDEFCRRAAPILAQERGLTTACRVKLAGLAQSLGLGERQMAAALRRLGGSADAAPHVQRFRNRLRKDLAGKTRAILGPTILQRIFAAAREKYGLEEAIARQVLDDVAAELNLTCIPPSKALEGLSVQVDQAIGGATWLARESWDRLRSAGVAWGIELEVVDELIEERLTANRAERARRRLWTALTVGGFSTAALLTVALVGLAIVRKAAWLPAATASAPPQRGPAVASSPARPPLVPGWWDVELGVDAAQVRRQLGVWPALARSWDDLTSPHAERRARAYEQWLAQAVALATASDRSRPFQRMLAGCYALEPSEEAAQRLLAALVFWLPGPGQRLPSAASGWHPALWAAGTAAEMLARSPPGPRAEAVQQAVARVLGEEPPRTTAEEATEVLAQLAVRAAYRQLAAAAAEQPGQVAALVARLRAHADRLLPPQRLAADTELLAAALPTAHDAWQAYQQAMISVATAEDPQYALRLVELLRRLKHEPLYAYLSGLLAERVGLRPLPAERGQAIVALRRALGGSAALTALDRWYLLQSAVEPLLAGPPPGDEARLIEQTALVAHYGTLAAALVQGEAGWPLFDAGMHQPPQVTSQPPAAVYPAGDAKPAARGTASAAPAGPASSRSSRRKELLRALELLHASGQAAAPQRESGWRMLVDLIADGETPGPNEAAQVARELWTSRTGEEHARLLVWLAVLRTWPQLLLAVADQLPVEGGLRPQQREILSVLLEDPVAEGTAPGALQRRLIARAAEVIQTQVRQTDAAVEDPLDRLAALLAQTYRARAGVWQVRQPPPDGELPTSEVVAALAVHLSGVSAAPAGSQAAAAGEAAHRTEALWEVRRQAIGLWADNDLGRTVGWQKLLLMHAAQSIAQDHPWLASAARQIVADTEARCRAAPSKLVQLYLQEAAWLRLWMLHAPPS